MKWLSMICLIPLMIIILITLRACTKKEVKYAIFATVINIIIWWCGWSGAALFYHPERWIFWN